MSGAEGAGARANGVRRLLLKLAESWRERNLSRRVRAAARPVDTDRVPRSSLGAALDARRAVRAGVRIDDFLRHRLARYATRLPVPLDALPVAVAVEGGEAVVRSRPLPGVLGPRLRSPSQSPATAAPLGGAFAVRRLADAEAALAQLRSREAAALARLDAVEKELADALASGAVVARPAIEVTAEQLGRPSVDAAWPILALRTLSGALLAAEAWRFSGPTLARLAVEPDGLELALRSAPGAVWLALLSAAGAALAAFTFAWLALAHRAQAMKDVPTVQRGRLLLAWSAGAALLVPSVALAATAPDPVAGIVLAVTLPFAGAALWRGSDALALRRSATAGAALVWDRERAREELERGRHLEAHARAAAELREAEELRAGAEARVSALHREASAEQSIAEHSARTAAARLERLCEGLAAALEQDRYLYLRTAGERALIPSEQPARTRTVDPSVGPGRLGITG